MVSLLTSYIQNFNKNTTPVQNNKQESDVKVINIEKQKPYFDIHRELANRTFIKPLPPKAHLVKNGIFDAPAIFVKDTIYDIKALKDGWNGDANDHQLGKLNDLGMKLGGLGIAAYLFTKKQTPTTKAMEFIGLGSFFASMALWPKLALQLPARLIHGFNVMPEYEDSYGRKKPLYQDNLFIPWDAAYTDKDIHKIGDRLGVPKDIPNRREYVQEKMRMIALQNNTMWMLTAGFATPIMSALICNAAEKPVTKLLDKYNSKKADEMLVLFSDYTQKAKNNKIINSVDSLIEIYKDRPIDSKMINSFANALGMERDMLLVDAIKEDLDRILLTGDEKYYISEGFVPSIVKDSREAMAKHFDKAIVDAIVPNEEQVLGRLKSPHVIRWCADLVGDTEKDKHPRVNKLFDEYLTKDEVYKVVREFDSMVRENIKKYNDAHPNNILRDDVEAPVMLRIIQGKTFETSPAGKYLLSMPNNKFDSEAQSLVRQLADVMTDFTAQTKVLDKYAYTKFGATSSLSNYWNEVDSSVLKILNFTDKDLEMVKGDRKLVTPMLREKIENIVADDKAYADVLDALCKKLSVIGETIKEQVVSEDYKRLTTDVYENSANRLRNLVYGGNPRVKMDSLIKELVGYDNLFAAQKAQQAQAKEQIVNPIRAYSQNDIQKSFAEGRLLSVKSSFERMINTLDFYRRVAKGENIAFKILKEDLPLEVKEELIDAAKELQLDAHMCDYETKFYVRRNPKPAKTKGDLVRENGKVIYQHFDKSKNLRKIDIPDDPQFFYNLMKLMYGNDMLAETEEVLVRHNLTGMREYRNAMMTEVGDVDYFAKKFHKLFTPYEQGSKTPSDRKFFLIGKSFTDLVYDAANNKYNTKQWLKMFGTIGAVLLGVTVGAQFFFGKLPAPKETKKG